MLSFDDIKNDHAKVLSFLDKTFFIDSTVTLADEEYITKSVYSRLVQVVLLNEQSLFIDSDVETLSRSMLRASLSRKDIDFILSSSLKLSGVTVNVKDTTEVIEEDKKKAEKLLEDKKNNICSLETIIQIIQDCVGTPRVSYFCYDELDDGNKMNHMLSGKPLYQTGPCLKVERPLKVEMSNINLAPLQHEKLIGFLQNSLDCDSNSILDLYIPLECLDSRITDFISDLKEVAKIAAKHASTASSNATSFTTDDPFKALFAGL